MMTEKQEAALRQAREALKKCDSALAEELAAWDIDPPLHHVLEASKACSPAIAAIDEALMSVSDGAQERSSEEQPAQVDPCIDGSCSCCWTHLDELPAQQDYWQEEARRYAQNAEFWRGKYEAATAQQQEPWRGLTDEQIAPINQQYHWLPTAFARAIEAKLRELNEHKEKNT